MNNHYEDIEPYCASLTGYSRRQSCEVGIGSIVIGGANPVAVQTMTDTDTNDTEKCVEQIGRVYEAGGRIVRLTAQGMREAVNLRNIAGRVGDLYPGMALVADIHFQPKVAYIAAGYVDKVRINPGNYNDKGGDFDALLDKCAERGVALRIGVNHGSLSAGVVEKWGDTPQGMVVSAMEFLRKCRSKGFSQVVVSMKSSNTRVMVYAYRLLAAGMAREGMDYPIHLGVTEAGNGAEGVIKSSIGIGALLADGIGDTIRVSLTEPPENEIPIARFLVDYFAERLDKNSGASIGLCDNLDVYNPYEYARRKSIPVGRVGGDNRIILYSELNAGELTAAAHGRIAVVSSRGDNPVGEWRAAIIEMARSGDRRPVILHRRYAEYSAEALMIKAAADFGVMFLDGLADGIFIENRPAEEGVLMTPSHEERENLQPVTHDVIDSIALDILQGARARISKTEYIACPGCGRTLFNLHDTLAAVKSHTSHLKGLKIGVMGCIVNGPGEMADADYGYVGASPGRVSLYRGRQLIRRNVPQEEALEALMDLIKSDGKWQEE